MVKLVGTTKEWLNSAPVVVTKLGAYYIGPKVVKDDFPIKYAPKTLKHPWPIC